MSFTTQDKNTFRDEQLEYPRVLNAFQEKGEEVYAMLKSKGVSHFSFDIYIRAFKFEEKLEVWAKNRADSTHVLVATYNFCSNVGDLGPKRKEGDKQIPEGAYVLSKFNPRSNFHLSLKVNYPNVSDSILSDRFSPGGMIFIHGGCRTVGCIPITDDKIKELYVFCVEATNTGQNEIPIHIFPARLTDENFRLMKEQYDLELVDFWRQLKVGYDLFQESKKVPLHEIDTSGVYTFY